MLYYVIDGVIRRDVEERLKVEKRDFENYIRVYGDWREGNYFVENKILLKRWEQGMVPPESFKDTVLLNKYTGEFVPFREINFFSKVNGQWYRVSIRKSLIESQSLLTYIIATSLVVLLLGLLLLYFFQTSLSKKLWSPFYFTLSQAKSYDLKSDSKIVTQTGGIFEFNELSKVLNKMLFKMRKDYVSLKEFSENASHEIQTPLSLINARVEQLIQQENLNEEQLNWIGDIHNSSLYLSKLNSALLLLSKISNDQFPAQQRLNFNELFKTKLHQLEDILAHKNIEVVVYDTGEFIVSINEVLGEILLSNLLSNAIRHNISHGRIEASFSKKGFVIRNTGPALQFPREKIFERFAKSHTDTTSTGLGLAIVKQIGLVCHLDITYQFYNEIHEFRVDQQEGD